jgi:glycosyltransferase involved in cell wall biosynthesis
MWSSLSIVMAAFNEEDALPACVERTMDFLRTHVADGELIIVNDGSTDRTGEIIDALSAEHDDIVAGHLHVNSGMGAALLEGYRVAGKEWFAMMPADGQIDAFEFLRFFEVADEADVVTSLYSNREYTLSRKALSYGLRLLTTAIVGTRARTEGSYMVRRTVYANLGAVSHSFLLNLEIPIRAKKGGYRVKTVYMKVHERIAGESKAVNLTRIKQTFTELFRLRIKMEKERRS